MAEAIVGSVAQWIGSILIQEANLLLEVRDQVDSLKKELLLMLGCLKDADGKQHKGEVGALIGQIRELAYDAEDVIDTYILKVEAKTKRQGYGDWFIRFACCIRSAPDIYEVGKRIDRIQKKRERIREQLNSCGVRGVSESQDSKFSYNEGHSRKKPQSFPYDNYGEYIVGLDKDISKLLQILMGEGDRRLNIVSIVGMGGSGKTTLARKLYNHQYSKECFDCCAWVFISQEWSTEHVLSEILREVGGPNVITELSAKPSKEQLVAKLRDILEKKSYLIVLDDVWKKEALQDIFPAILLADNKSGSKIIITTRNQEVFQFEDLQNRLYIHKAKPLTEEDAWKLFSKIAFDQCNDCNIQSFENLGKEMLRKCDGLPLAIVALAGILSSKGSIKEWKQVRDAVLSRVMESTGSYTSGTVGVMLGLSYDDLPYDLKGCFLYLGAFPEDCQIATGMLTRMWIAEGLVTGSEGMKLEYMAMQKLEKLSHRFMIQVVRTNFSGEIKAIRLHDLLHDLCVKKAKELGFFEVYASVRQQAINDVQASAIQPRRAALHSCSTFPTEVSHLRSLVLLATSSFALSGPLFKDMLDLQSVYKFKLLRLLSLWGIKTPNCTLPVQVGSLIHLRYLGIRHTNITELPRSIGSLRNLLTLDYRNIESDSNASIEIPDVLGKLVRLRHLFLPIESPWNVEKNLDLSTLEYLQTLWGVKDGGEGCWLSEQFPKLSATLKKLMIVVSTEKELVECFSSPSIMSDRLQTFHCELTNGLALQHVKPLSDKQNLYKLKLIGQLQVKLSLLVPSNIIVLELKDSMLKNDDPMIVLGALAHLKLLRLSNSYLGTTFACKTGSFPLLEELYLDNFQNLETWRIEKGAMLCLKRLEIVGCTKLQHFPQGLALLINLKQLEFFGMPKEFEEKARDYGWSQKKIRLPHKYEAIIEKSDSAIDSSSIHRIYEQLIAGIFLNNKQQKFWVVKADEVYYNCFMVYAADLSLATQVDIDGLPLWNAQMDHWKFTEIAERDGAVIKVAKLISLPRIHVLDISGRISIDDLSPNATYAIACVIRFDNNQVCVRSALVLPNGIIQTQKRNLQDKPRNEWIRVAVGEFERRSNYEGVAEFFLHFQWAHPSEVQFEIRGAIIEPKTLAADI